MANISPLCRQFAAILRAQPQIINGVCTASSVRNNIRPVILGKRSRSFLTIPQAFSFESVGPDGRALCLGETVVLTPEINPFITRLRRHGIIVTPSTTIGCSPAPTFGTSILKRWSAPSSSPAKCGMRSMC